MFLLVPASLLFLLFSIKQVYGYCCFWVGEDLGLGAAFGDWNHLSGNSTKKMAFRK